MNMAIYADKGDLAIKKMFKPRLLRRLCFFFRFRKDVYYPAILLGRIYTSIIVIMGQKEWYLTVTSRKWAE